MSLQSRQSGTQFHKPVHLHTKGTLSPEEWAVIMLLSGWANEKGALQYVIEGLGTIEAESSFNSNPGGDGAHFGAWQEDDSFGSVHDRLDPQKSTEAAYRRWKADGKSFYPAWTRWQIEQSGVNGAKDLGPKHKAAAEAAIVKLATMQPSGGGPQGLVEGAIGVGGDVVGAVESAGDFLNELAHTLLDFRKLGQLAAEAMAWFIRLLLKALWDYVVAPLWHWAERAVTWYWKNFFTVGTERGSGVGYILRQNAGMITILFWAIGYAVLWSDGESLSPASAQDSMLGRGVRGIEGAIARRNLTKPKDVKKATPDKPKPKASSASIARVKEVGTERSRPVKVTDTTKGTPNERGNSGHSQRVARPKEAPSSQGSKGAAEQGQIFQAKQVNVQAPAKRGAGMGSRTDSRDRIKSRTGRRGAKRN